MPIYLVDPQDSSEENRTNPIVRILLTESKTKILYNKPSTTLVIYRQSSSFDSIVDQHEYDDAELVTPEEKSETFMKDEMTQTQQSECFVMVKQKSTYCNTLHCD